MGKEKNFKLLYLKEYLSLSKDSEIKERVKKILQSGEDPKHIDNLYQLVRLNEKKVPSLYFPQTSFAKLSLETSLEASLKVKQEGKRISLYLDGINIVSYSSDYGDSIGRKAVIRESDLEGNLFLNSDFFNRFDIPKNKDSQSDTRNIAKAFFTLSGKNHVALVQYLKTGGNSQEHYHIFPEIIVQLVGETQIVLRNKGQDSKSLEYRLSSGDVFNIPPYTTHRIQAQKGSITIPIKQTNPKRSDYFVEEMSHQRIQSEIDMIIDLPHYNSGNELIHALTDFHTTLAKVEKEKFLYCLDERLSKEKNNNLITIIEEVKKRI
jgi:quercetin dioxygenase-like cupin family protein